MMTLLPTFFFFFGFFGRMDGQTSLNEKKEINDRLKKIGGRISHLVNWKKKTT